MSETATSTIEPKSSRFKEPKRRLVSVDCMSVSTLACSHGCPMVSTSFFDLERDRERDCDRLSFDRFASFCPFDSFGKAVAGIRYPPLVSASIWRCWSSSFDLGEDSFFGRWANCKRRRRNGFRSCFGFGSGSGFASGLDSLGEIGTGSAVVVSEGLEG